MTTTPARPSRLTVIPRAVRRALVLGCYGGYALMCLAWSVMPQPWRWLVVVPAGLISVAATGALLVPALLGTSDGADAQLDERQIAARNRGYLNAYRILGTAVTLAALYAYIAADSGRFWLPHTGNELTAFFWGAWLFAVTLPAAVIAWTEPEPLED